MTLRHILAGSHIFWLRIALSHIFWLCIAFCLPHNQVDTQTKSVWSKEICLKSNGGVRRMHGRLSSNSEIEAQNHWLINYSSRPFLHICIQNCLYICSWDKICAVDIPLASLFKIGLLRANKKCYKIWSIKADGIISRGHEVFCFCSVL
jgi:hypothetical protein